MPYRIVKAEGAVDALVWLFLGIIWVIAQIVSQAKKARHGSSRLPPPPRSTPRRNIDEDLRQIMESVLGQPLPPQVPQPPPLEEQKPLPPVVRHRQARVKPPARQVARPRLPAIPSPTPIPEPPPHPAPVVEPVESLAWTRPVRGPRQAVAMPNTPMLRVRSLRLPGMGMSGIVSGANPWLARTFRDRRALRNAVVARIVLGPPRAFE